ncbi:MAG: hypothetical protein APF80_03895 [Alphaproteobacteria bacterium BRH_c36]|nr:MAG: hypothetical protein APF80_03895 [Alphaproteobacteria bacterium BRH_c36]
MVRYTFDIVLPVATTFDPKEALKIIDELAAGRNRLSVKWKHATAMTVAGLLNNSLLNVDQRSAVPSAERHPRTPTAITRRLEA